MLKKVKIRNFRSIEKEDIGLAPLTVLYGPTATGKSSLIYSIMVLKNFFTNPNQTSDGLFNLGFMSLGGYESVIFDSQKDREITISAEFEEGEILLSFGKNKANINVNTDIVKMSAQVPLPYALNQNFQYTIKYREKEFKINWNGIVASVVPVVSDVETQQLTSEIANKLNSLQENFRKIDIVPHRRGFFKPLYVPSTISQLILEDEIATILINEPDIVDKVSLYLEEIVNRTFRIHTYPGTANTELRTADKKAKVSTLLVNDGYGVNQLVFMLAKILRQESKSNYD